MTQKELLYVEDAIGHEDNIICICDNIKESLTDEQLICFIENETKKHIKTRDLLIGLLEDKANE